jgi:hypothetical protein
VDSHQDLPSDGREVDAMVITMSNRIRWSLRSEIRSERRFRAAGGWPVRCGRAAQNGQICTIRPGHASAALAGHGRL